MVLLPSHDPRFSSALQTERPPVLLPETVHHTASPILPFQEDDFHNWTGQSKPECQSFPAFRSPQENGKSYYFLWRENTPRTRSAHNPAYYIFPHIKDSLFPWRLWLLPCTSHLLSGPKSECNLTHPIYKPYPWRQKPPDKSDPVAVSAPPHPHPAVRGVPSLPGRSDISPHLQWKSVRIPPDTDPLQTALHRPAPYCLHRKAPH